MEELQDLELIDVQLDEYFTRKQISRCKDEFLNTLCEEEDADNDGDEHVSEKEEEDDKEEGQQKKKELQVDSDYEEDSDDDFAYSTHNPNVKWNLMKPMFGERSWFLVPSGLDAYEVRNGIESYGVDLGTRRGGRGGVRGAGRGGGRGKRGATSEAKANEKATDTGIKEVPVEIDLSVV
ncbi:hypothetical protein L2E82_13916 [Cichorium intybus]|uniref:Uncharacterized protein n=1 Tax=Cichorium intybus TaxID=13427 RepID=A0ACB9EZ63_CICIN|nr:hypothetical protein L2E82_13916 [Cichorium intybus]